MQNHSGRTMVGPVKEILRSLLIGASAGLAGAALTALGAGIGATSLSEATPVGVVLAIAMGAMHYWRSAQFHSTCDRFRQIINRLSSLQDRVTETQALVQLSGYNQTYPMPFGGDWALTPDAAVVLAREIVLHKPSTIVELGSGVSTVLIGRVLQQSGYGRLISLDHDSYWAEETRRHIRAGGLEHRVEVLDAPLTKQRFDEKEFTWYRIPDSLFQGGEIDMLIVDGPPQSIDPGGMPRYPALPIFHPRLSSRAMIYIDDAKRPCERAMVEKWLEEYPGWKQRIVDTVPGTCLLERC